MSANEEIQILLLGEQIEELLMHFFPGLFLRTVYPRPRPGGLVDLPILTHEIMDGVLPLASERIAIIGVYLVDRGDGLHETVPVEDHLEFSSVIGYSLSQFAVLVLLRLDEVQQLAGFYEAQTGTRFLEFPDISEDMREKDFVTHSPVKIGADVSDDPEGALHYVVTFHSLVVGFLETLHFDPVVFAESSVIAAEQTVLDGVQADELSLVGYAGGAHGRTVFSARRGFGLGDNKDLFLLRRGHRCTTS